MAFPVFPEGPRVLSPTGLVVYPEDPSTGYPANASNAVPGQVLCVRGPESYPVTSSDPLYGRRGYLDMQVYLGIPPTSPSVYRPIGRRRRPRPWPPAPHSPPQSLFAIVGADGAYFAVSIDPTGNNIQFGMSDGQAVTVAQTNAASFGDNMVVRLVVSFDAVRGVASASFDGTPATWTVEPSGPWLPFRPTRIDIGTETPELGLDGFDGALYLAQYGEP